MPGDTILVKRDENRAERWDRTSLAEYLGDTPGRVIKETRHNDGSVTTVTHYEVPWQTLTTKETRWTRVLVTETAIP